MHVGSHARGVTRVPPSNPPPSAMHLSFGADTWFGDRCCVSGSLQEPRRDARGAGHVLCRMPRPDAALGCVGRQELCHRVGDLPSSPRRSPRQGGQGRSAARGHHAVVLEIQRCAIVFGRRRLAFACADCMVTNSPRRAEPSALVGKNTSGTVQPADGAQYRESSATSCAARLRDCRAHGSARRRSISLGEPLATRLPLGISMYTLSMYLEMNISVNVYIYL
jgi:hypothetical protein